MIIEKIHLKDSIGSHIEPIETALEVDFTRELYSCENGLSEAGYFITRFYPARELGKEGRAGIFVRSLWIAINGYSDEGTDEQFVPFDSIN